MRINNVSGYFDCRKYAKDVQRSQRKMVADGERINFTIAFTDKDLPEEAAEFAHKAEKSGLNYVTVKIFPQTCKVYTASAQRIEFPPLSDLDGGKFELNLDVAIKHGTGTELNGLYANAVQIVRRADNPFDAIEGVDDVFGSPKKDIFEDVDKTTEFVTESPKVEAKAKKEAEPINDLPF